MKVRKCFLVLVISLISIGVNAADYCSTWGCISTIEDIYTNGSGTVYVSTPLDETLANCTPHSGVYFVLAHNVPNFQEIYSTLLAAYMSNSKIQLRIIEGTSNCQLAYVRLSKTF